MIVLDASILSEAPRERPDEAVGRWLTNRRSDALYVTTTVIAEIAQGVERLPQGYRRRRFEGWLEELVQVDFAGRVLPFDLESALEYGRVVARAAAAGRTPGMADAQIAAVARRHGMGVATRDVSDFAALGVELVNPFEG